MRSGINATWREEKNRRKIGLESGKVPQLYLSVCASLSSSWAWVAAGVGDPRRRAEAPRQDPGAVGGGESSQFGAVLHHHFSEEPDGVLARAGGRIEDSMRRSMLDDDGDDRRRRRSRGDEEDLRNVGEVGGAGPAIGVPQDGAVEGEAVEVQRRRRPGRCREMPADDPGGSADGAFNQDLPPARRDRRRRPRPECSANPDQIRKRWLGIRVSNRRIRKETKKENSDHEGRRSRHRKTLLKRAVSWISLNPATTKS